MVAFSSFNPISIIIYYTCVVILGLFNPNPVTALISLCGALTYRTVLCGNKNRKEHIFALVLFLSVTVINPIFSHNGKTVLFVMNDNPITLEALIYGIVMSAMLVSAFYWLKTFTEIMTSAKLLFTFGKVSPKTALMLSMTLRILPMLSNQWKKIENTQKTMGLYCDKDIFSLLKSKTKVLSILITWAIENAIVTADSMEARGYSGKSRTSYSLFKFCLRDGILSLLSILLTAPTTVSLLTGVGIFEFYPSIVFPKPGVLIILSYITFGILCLIPTFTEAGDKIKWKFYLSRI